MSAAARQARRFSVDEQQRQAIAVLVRAAGARDNNQGVSNVSIEYQHFPAVYDEAGSIRHGASGHRVRRVVGRLLQRHRQQAFACDDAR